MSWLPVPEKYVGKQLRWAVFLTALIEMPWCGMYFGWAPIQYVMKNEDYFIQDCWAARENVTATNSTSRQARSGGGGAPLATDDECVIEQDRIFNWLYLTADVTNYLTTYLFGVIFDIYGSRAMRLLCNLFLFAASIFGTIARPGETEWLLLSYDGVPRFGLNSAIHLEPPNRKPLYPLRTRSLHYQRNLRRRRRPHDCAKIPCREDWNEDPRVVGCFLRRHSLLLL